MKRLIGIIQFMTRIPIKMDIGFDEKFYKSIIYFPIVGLILGVCYYGIGYFGLKLFNSYMTAVIVLIGEVILTGGLHLDGVGDTFDGLYSYRDKERILEIMKDSRLGTNGMLAISLLLLLKLFFVEELLTRGGLWGLIVMPVVARSMQVLACYKTRTPREKGMGNIFIGKVSPLYLIGVFALQLVIVMGCVFFWQGVELMVYGQVLLVILVISLLVRLFIRSVYKKIEGITGDILGCICELSELAFLVGIYFVR